MKNLKKQSKFVLILTLVMVVLSGCFLLSACGQDDNDATLTPLDNWSFKVGDSLINAAVPNFHAKGTEVFIENGEKVTRTITADSIAEAIEKGMVCQGLDTSTEGSRTMTVVWLGKVFTVKYTVGKATTGGGGTSSDGGGED